MPANTRPSLGGFVAAECLQLMRLYFEDLAGWGPVLGAGRMRGAGLAEGLGLAGARHDDATITEALRRALGPEGTKLCLVEEVTSEGNAFTVRIVEGACSYNRDSEEPMCAYTLGVFLGAVGAMLGEVMTGSETQCQATGASACVYEFAPHVAIGAG